MHFRIINLGQKNLRVYELETNIKTKNRGLTKRELLILLIINLPAPYLGQIPWPCQITIQKGVPQQVQSLRPSHPEPKPAKKSSLSIKAQINLKITKIMLLQTQNQPTQSNQLIIHQVRLINEHQLLKQIERQVIHKCHFA